MLLFRQTLMRTLAPKLRFGIRVDDYHNVKHMKEDMQAEWHVLYVAYFVRPLMRTLAPKLRFGIRVGRLSQRETHEGRHAS